MPRAAHALQLRAPELGASRDTELRERHSEVEDAAVPTDPHAAADNDFFHAEDNTRSPARFADDRAHEDGVGQQLSVQAFDRQQG